MKVVFPFSQVVIVITMVVSTRLVTMLSSGALPKTAATTPGTAACTTTMSMFTGTTLISQLVLLSVA
jgi:hypothetical protein